MRGAYGVFEICAVGATVGAEGATETPGALVAADTSDDEGTEDTASVPETSVESAVVPSVASSLSAVARAGTGS